MALELQMKVIGVGITLLALGYASIGLLFGAG